MTGAAPAGAARRGGVAEEIHPLRLARAVATAAIESRGLLLCTDFDGSLAPLTNRPSRAMALAPAGRAIAWLSRAGAARGTGALCPTRAAVITGRDSDDVATRLPLGPEAVVVGNYGLERTVGGRPRLAPSVARWLPALDAAARQLRAALDSGFCPGARLEAKRVGVVLHTRGVERAGAALEALALAAEVGAGLGLTVIPGKQSAELRPPVRRDKGQAVQGLRRGAFATAAVCVAGDDHGDVPMLQLDGRLPVPTVSIAVDEPETPQEVLDAARWRIAGPSAWAATLARIVDLLVRPAEAGGTAPG